MGTSASFNNPSYGGFPGPAPGLGAPNAGGAMADLPTPEQLAPDVMNGVNTNATAAQCCQPPVPQCATVPMLHTHSIALADPMAPIPSPQQLAPHVFFNYPANPAPATQQAQQPQQRGPQTQQPQQPQQPPQPPPAQPKQPPQQPPQQPQQPQQKGQDNAPKGRLDEFDGALSDTVVKSLNKQLNDPDEGTRASAATDLCNILQKHPTMATNPAYKPYINAFMDKIMSDPSSLVRGVGEMTLQLGHVKEPTEKVRTTLKKLSMKDDANLTKENDQASSILTGLENGTLGTDIVDTRDKDKKGTAPGSTDPNAKGATGSATGQAKGADATGQQNGQTPGAEPTPGAPAQGAQTPDAQTPADPNASAMTKTPGVAGGAPPTPAPANDPGADASGATPDATGNPAAANSSATDAAALQTPPATGGMDPASGASAAASAAGAGGAFDPSAAQAAAQGGQSAQPWPTAAGNNQAYAQPYAQAYPPSDASVAAANAAQNYGIPAKMATGSGLGHKLNLLSHSPKSFLPSWMQSNAAPPNTGQRLNMYEGQTT